MLILYASDPVVVKVLARFVSRVTGVSVDMQVVELLIVHSGLITEVENES